MSKLHTYQSDDIEVRYDVKRCIHAAECVRSLPQVFDPDERPWIQPKKASADEVAAAVERRPTGALTYRRLDAGDSETPPGRNAVQLVNDGPLFLSGDITISDAGQRAPERSVRIALCRCGASGNKPFCDNSHIEAGFTSG